MKLDYLIDTYNNKEDWHTTRMEHWQVKEHFRRQLTHDNVTFMTGTDDEIVGYLEIYWLNKYQAANVMNNKFFDVLEENLTEGDIVYVASAYLEPKYRGKGNIHDLNRMMKEKHKDRNYVGIMYEQHNTGTFKFYKKGEI